MDLYRTPPMPAVGRSYGIQPQGLLPFLVNHLGNLQRATAFVPPSVRSAARSHIKGPQPAEPYNGYLYYIGLF